MRRTASGRRFPSTHAARCEPAPRIPPRAGCAQQRCRHLARPAAGNAGLRAQGRFGHGSRVVEAARQHAHVGAHQAERGHTAEQRVEGLADLHVGPEVLDGDHVNRRQLTNFYRVCGARFDAARAGGSRASEISVLTCGPVACRRQAIFALEQACERLPVRVARLARDLLDRQLHAAAAGGSRWRPSSRRTARRRCGARGAATGGRCRPASADRAARRGGVDGFDDAPHGLLEAWPLLVACVAGRVKGGWSFAADHGHARE